VRRWARAYGTKARLIVGRLKSAADLGRCFGADLYECEARYLAQHEWVRRADDLLWRRSKLGLRLSAEQAADLDAFLAEITQRTTAQAAS
jgi:glycerol-3-phosphate dehydrogenase